jgi:hypothetical protein
MPTMSCTGQSEARGHTRWCRLAAAELATHTHGRADETRRCLDLYACRRGQRAPAAPQTLPAPPPPLFTPETMAQDTPPLMLKLLEDPTREHARAFFAWQQRRDARITAVQPLVRRLTRPHGELRP